MRRNDAGVAVPDLDGGLEGALQKLKKQLSDAGLFRDLRRHEAYAGPGERRRQKRAQAAKRRRQAAAARQLARGR